jgi:hypothetical protein
MRSITLAMATMATVFALTNTAGWAQHAFDLGNGAETVLVPAPGEDCAVGVLFHHHDGSIENGYCWDGLGMGPPYYGAFGEGYDLGPGTVVCGSYWLTQLGHFTGAALDAYVWAGGVSGVPGEVICLVTGTVPGNIPYWPAYGQNDVEIMCDVTGEFTLGWWADWGPYFTCQWYICADEDGAGGYPWTCILPGLGYPTGWQPVSMIFPDCASLAIGTYFTEVWSPVTSPTWGSIKVLFR